MVNFTQTRNNCNVILLFACLLWLRGHPAIGIEPIATKAISSPTTQPPRQLNDNVFGGNLNISNDIGQWTNNGEERILRRGKRYLDFVKGSRMSWRLMLKFNILKVNTQWAHGIGLRTNYPFPAKEDRYARPFFKRDLFHMVEDVMDGHGFDGRACILKTYCAAMHWNEGRDNGMLFRLMKMVFSLEAHEKRHMPYLNSDNCDQLLYSHCPLDLDALTPYTDLVT